MSGSDYDAADNARGSYEAAVEALRSRLLSFRREKIGDCILYNADCREVLPLMPAVDLVVTDPPYGIAYVTSFRNVSDAPAMLANDDRAPLDSVALMMRAIKDTGAIYLCTRQDVAEPWRDAIVAAGGTLKTAIIWDKTNHTAGDLEGDYGAQTELVLFAHKGRHKLRDKRDVNLWRIPRPTFGNHPTPKPVDLIGRAIRNSSDAGGLVLDPFMGEGPTGVAAVRLGRKFIGVELDPDYFNAACLRIAAAYAQPDMFVEAQAKPEQLNMLKDKDR
jgi:site-specific DNA-methyltransferase (adenine-specific)